MEQFAVMEPLVGMLSEYRDVFLLGAVAGLSLMIVVLWVRVVRLCRAVGQFMNVMETELTVPSRSDGEASSASGDGLRDAVDALGRRIEEEAARVNTVQRMLVEFRETVSSSGRVAEKNFHAVVDRLNDRIDRIERESPAGGKRPAGTGVSAS